MIIVHILSYVFYFSAETAERRRKGTIHGKYTPWRNCFVQQIIFIKITR